MRSPADIEGGANFQASNARVVRSLKVEEGRQEMSKISAKAPTDLVQVRVSYYKQR